jgi:hypothetical protein
MTTGQQVAAPAEPTARRRLASSPAIGFVPWILFWVIGGPSTWETATIAALLAALLVLALSLDLGSRGGGRAMLAHLKLLDAATVLFFAGMTVAAIVTSRHDVAELDRYAQVISSGALALIALGSMAAGHPFTVDYAREQTPRQYWHTPLFRQVNQVLTGAWAAVFAICAGLGLWAQQTSVKGLRDWLNWYIPILLIFAAFRFTRWYPDRARSGHHGGPRG